MAPVVLDITSRLRKSPRAPRGPAAVSWLRPPPPTVAVGTEAPGGGEDGRVHLRVEGAGAGRLSVPLDCEGAMLLSRLVRRAAEDAARRAGRLVAMRTVGRHGATLARPKSFCWVVDVRGTAALLEAIDTGERAWYSIDTGDPARKPRRRDYLRIVREDVDHLRRKAREQQP